ncbi:hypothetical protein K438DRAFT_1749929 [Mycena galopus ATCC 62051]|nr:hypothetical protein K438DRAFT_1749929 [Mycena galopus ATCC 62051]
MASMEASDFPCGNCFHQSPLSAKRQVQKATRDGCDRQLLFSTTTIATSFRIPFPAIQEQMRNLTIEISELDILYNPLTEASAATGPYMLRLEGCDSHNSFILVNHDPLRITARVDRPPPLMIETQLLRSGSAPLHVISAFTSIALERSQPPWLCHSPVTARAVGYSNTQRVLPRVDPLRDIDEEALFDALKIGGSSVDICSMLTLIAAGGHPDFTVESFIGMIKSRWHKSL